MSEVKKLSAEQKAFFRELREKAKAMGLIVPRVDFEVMPEMFENHKGQAEAWGKTEDIVAVLAGWQSGKSTMGPPWLMREIQRRGEGDYAIICPSYPLLWNKALPEFMRMYGEYFVFKRGDYELLLTDKGSRALFGEPGKQVRVLLRHGERPEAIEAFVAKAIWVDEAGQLANEVWESIQARVSTTRGRVILTTRPYRWNFMVTDIWERRNSDPKIAVVNFRSVDNPAFPQEEYDRQKELLPSWKFLMKYDGIPTRPEGLVYDCFDDQKHVCIGDIPGWWPKYLGVDFGRINTAGVAVAAECDAETRQETGRYIIYKTYKGGEVSMQDHARNLLACVGSKPHYCVAGNRDELGWRESLGTAGLWGFPPNERKVEVQIARVYSAFMQGKVLVHRDCVEMIDELYRFSYKLDDNGDATDKYENEASYHLLASLRYIGDYLFREGREMRLVQSIGRTAGPVETGRLLIGR